MKIANILSFVIFLIAPAACFGQEGRPFVLLGQINNPKLDSVSILYINSQGKVNRETVPASNGAFRIEGAISQPTMSYILFIHKGEKLSKKEIELRTNKVFIEPGEMVITQEADSNGYVQLKGSKSQAEWNELISRTRPLKLTKDSLAEINHAYFKDHPGSYVSANQVMFFTSVFSLDSLKHLYDNYTDEIKESIDGRRLAAQIKSRTAGLPGTMAFQFSVKDKDGKNLSLADFKGKYVLLDFWATWCVPCRKSMPHKVGLYQKYKEKGFDVIAIADDDNRIQEWKAAIEHDGITMFHHTLRGINMELTRKGMPNPRDLDEGYGVRALPTLILIDPEGKIVGRFGSNEEKLDKMLATIFKQ